MLEAHSANCTRHKGLRFVLNLIWVLNKAVNLEMFFLVSYQDFPSLGSSE